MKRNCFVVSFMIFMLVLFVGSSFAVRGYIVKFKTSGKTEGTKIEYITPTAYKLVMPDKITIAKIQNGTLKVYSLNPRTKTYMDMSQMAGFLVMGIMEFLECDQAGNCKERTNFLTPLGIKEKVGRWNAEKFKLNPSQGGLTGAFMKAFKTESYSWLSREPGTLIKAERTRIKFYENVLKALNKGSNPMAAAQSNRIYSKAINAMKKFLKKYGVRVKTVTTTNMGFISNTTVEEFLSAEKANIPEKEFQVPAGYRPSASPMGFGHKNFGM